MDVFQTPSVYQAVDTDVKYSSEADGDQDPAIEGLHFVLIEIVASVIEATVLFFLVRAAVRG